MNKVSAEYLPPINSDYENSLEKKSEEFNNAMKSGDWETAEKAQQSYEHMMVEMKPLNAETLELLLDNLDQELIKASGARNVKRESILLKIKDKLLAELDLVRQSESLNKKLHSH